MGPYPQAQLYWAGRNGVDGRLNEEPAFLENVLLRCIIMSSPFLVVFTQKILMYEMFSFLGNCMPIGDQRYA